MAVVSIKYSCGCGFSTHSLEDAIDHTEKTSHTITSVVCTIKK